MRRFTMVAVLAAGTVLGVLTPAAGSTAAWADGPQNVKSTFTFENPQPPGAFCDHIAALVTHTNLDTSFTLTEVDHFTVFTAADGQTKTVGIIWHLRDANGKIVVVQSGQLVISPTGEIVTVTPAINPDTAAVICPALGGQPAI